MWLNSNINILDVSTEMYQIGLYYLSLGKYWLPFQRLIYCLRKCCVLLWELLGENMYLSDVCGSAVLSDGDMVNPAGHCGKACPGSCFWPRRIKTAYWRQGELKS